MSALTTCSLHPRLPILLPHALIPGQFTPTTILVCWLLTHRFWTNLVSHRHFVPLHELLLTFTQGIVAVTHTQPISRPFSCCCSPTSPGRAVHSSRGLIVSLTHGKFWVFPRLLAVSFSLIWDCCFPCVLWVVVFNFVLCHYGFPIRGLSFCISGLCIVAMVFTLKLGCCCCFPGLGCCG